MLTSPDQTIGHSGPEEEPTPREQEVLAVVLDLMVEEGDGFSMSKVCRRASCSKETLYNWFGDRDGLLTATVQWQASKVRLPNLSSRDMTAEQFSAALESFAISWLEVITGDVSAALNRLAISHAGSGKSRLGRIVLQNGPRAISGRLQKMFLSGEQAGILAIDDIDGALRTFFGLVVSDWQIRKLLGEKTVPTPASTETAAKRAVAQFMTLYTSKNSNKTPKTGE